MSLKTGMTVTVVECNAKLPLTKIGYDPKGMTDEQIRKAQVILETYQRIVLNLQSPEIQKKGETVTIVNCNNVDAIYQAFKPFSRHTS